VNSPPSVGLKQGFIYIFRNVGGKMLTNIWRTTVLSEHKLRLNFEQPYRELRVSSSPLASSSVCPKFVFSIPLAIFPLALHLCA